MIRANKLESILLDELAHQCNRFVRAPLGVLVAGPGRCTRRLSARDDDRHGLGVSLRTMRATRRQSKRHGTVYGSAQGVPVARRCEV